MSVRACVRSCVTTRKCTWACPGQGPARLDLLGQKWVPGHQKSDFAHGTRAPKYDRDPVRAASNRCQTMVFSVRKLPNGRLPPWVSLPGACIAASRHLQRLSKASKACFGMLFSSQRHQKACFCDAFLFPKAVKSMLLTCFRFPKALENMLLGCFPDPKGIKKHAFGMLSGSETVAVAVAVAVAEAKTCL